MHTYLAEWLQREILRNSEITAPLVSNRLGEMTLISSSQEVPLETAKDVESPSQDLAFKHWTPIGMDSVSSAMAAEKYLSRQAIRES